MYICVRTNENLDILVKKLLERDLRFEVSRHDSLSWIKVYLEEKNYSALVRFYSKELSIISLDRSGDDIDIKFEDLETIYEL